MTPLQQFTNTLPQVPVSSETLARLEVYVRLLERWNAKINLVSPKTLTEVWPRHILDSAQLFPYLKDARTLVDIGSGAGFPGLVLAILSGLPTTLIESDQRKGIFMREVSRETKALAQIVTARIEDAPPQAADVLTARALAPLAQLLPLIHRHLAPTGRAVLLKGAGWQEEVDAARKAGQFSFRMEHYASATARDAAILVLTELQPAERAQEGA